MSGSPSDLLLNDSDPQNQPLTVPPSRNHRPTASSAAHSPAASPTHLAPTQLRQHRPPHQLSGHRHRRTLPASRASASWPPATPTNHRSPATTWRAPTRHGVALITSGNDFDPDGDSFGIVEVNRPAHGSIDDFVANSSTTRPTPGSPVSRPSPTPSATATASSAPVPATVEADTGTGADPTPRFRRIDYLVVYQGSSVALTPPICCPTTRDPQGQTLTVVAVSDPSNGGLLFGTLATGSPSPLERPAVRQHRPQINYLVTDTDGHVPREIVTIRILAAGDTNQAPVTVRTPHRPTGDSVSCSRRANDFDPDGDGFERVGVDPPRTAITSQLLELVQLHARRRVLRHERSPTASATATACSAPGSSPSR